MKIINYFALSVVQQFQKLRAFEIKQLKNQRKKSIFGYVKGLNKKQKEYRESHVALSELFGTPYHKIESEHKRHSNGQLINPLNRDEVNKLKDQYKNFIYCEISEAPTLIRLEEK